MLTSLPFSLAGPPWWWLLPAAGALLPKGYAEVVVVPIPAELLLERRALVLAHKG